MGSDFCQLISLAKLRYANYVKKYKTYSPVYFARRLNKNIGLVGACLKFLVFSFYGVYLFFFRRSSGECFVFEGTRFSDIHAILPPERVVILGGWRARRYCARHGYGFEWDGYIKALFFFFYCKKKYN